MNDTICLVRPTSEYHTAIAAYKAAFLSRGDSLDGTAFLQEAPSIADWLVQIELASHPATVPVGLAVAHVWLLIDKQTRELLGMTNLRMELSNDYLKNYGGHIGYSIHPDKRRMGLGTKILALTLEKAKELGLKQVLVTCDQANQASAKIIENNQGVFEKSVSPSAGEQICRYWIDLSYVIE